MSDLVNKAYQATPNATLRDQIMDPNFPKNEREWWAAARIEQLEAALREIDHARYTGRNTINLDNAYEMAIALNAKLLAVMDTARAALEEPHKTLGVRGPHVHSSEQILPLPAEASDDKA